MCTTMPGEPWFGTRVQCLSCPEPTVSPHNTVLLQKTMLALLLLRDSLEWDQCRAQQNSILFRHTSNLLWDLR